METLKENSISKKDLQRLILKEKQNGTPDLEIGKKYGVTFRYIEKVMTKTQGVNISSFKNKKKIKTLIPSNFSEEKGTVWSFRQRGSWATHSGEYRGNWSPYIPRNVILKYSKPGEIVLDYFCGAGTTAVEAKLLGRRCIALDINGSAIKLAKSNLDFNVDYRQKDNIIKEGIPNIFYEPELSIGDARDLSFLRNDSIDLICAHPPYANIIHYTNHKDTDLSFFDINEFLDEMKKVAKESYRVLKPGRQCAILIGDTRRKKHVIPLGFKLIDVYLNAGFKLKELVIKRQHQCKTTGFWYNNSIKYNFLLLAHEHLPIFEKPKRKQSIKRISKINNILSYFQSLNESNKLENVETTTVWILPAKTYEKTLNKNIINRYTNLKKYYSVSIDYLKDSLKMKRPLEFKADKELLFIKSPILNIRVNYSIINNYIDEINKLIEDSISKIKIGGYLIIQTEDIRINGYVEPLAKYIIDRVTNKNLWLKEITVLTNDNNKNINDIKNKYLIKSHQYLIVYERL